MDTFIKITNFIIKFFDSSFFIAIVTLTVGGFAVFLYKKQKNDYKKDTALLVLQEIRYSEQQIRNSRSLPETSYPLSGKLLPTNSWYKNIHLFMGNFEQAQIDAISRFYSQIEYIDLVIEKISDYKNSIIIQSIEHLSGKEISREEILPENVYLNEIEKILMNKRNLQKEDNEQIINTPQTTGGISNSKKQPEMVLIKRLLKSSEILKDVTNKVEFIYNTPIGEKLREISQKKMKWYQTIFS